VKAVTATIPTLNVAMLLNTKADGVLVRDSRKLFGEALGFDSIKSTFIFGEYDAALVDSMMRSLRPRLSQIGLLCAG
jgi:hypothetical protein